MLVVFFSGIDVPEVCRKYYMNKVKYVLKILLIWKMIWSIINIFLYDQNHELYIFKCFCIFLTIKHMPSPNSQYHNAHRHFGRVLRVLAI